MAYDHCLPMSQSDSSIAHIDPASPALVLRVSQSSTALSPSSVSVTFACLTTPASPVIDNLPNAAQASPSPPVGSNGATYTPDSELNASMQSPNASNPNLDVDPQILEALKNKDRIFVLKLGEAFEALIKERRTRIEVKPDTSYQRLLVHRCSAYYKLQPDSDAVTKTLSVALTSESKIPERRICELVPVELPTQPAFKIMKRDPRPKPHSHAGSVAGEDADLSDVEPSESGSVGGQSYIANFSTRKRMTIEEREAAYNEARSRIFMGFEEKDKGNASSSALSVSGSTSSNGRSIMGDTDDAASSPATESEWSAASNSFLRDPKREGRRGGVGPAPSSRTLRGGSSFHANGSGNSSRNSRAASPSFSYPSLYEPSPPAQAYDVPHHGSNVGYQPYSYPYPSNQGHNPSFLPPYPYFPPQYPFQPPPMSQPNPPDSSSPTGPEGFSPHHMNYTPPYGWSPHPNQPPMQSPPHNMHPSMPPLQHQQNGLHQMGSMPPAPSHSTPYQPYMQHPAYPYPMNPYYSTSPPGQTAGPVPTPSHMPIQPPLHPNFDPRTTNSNPMLHPDGFFGNNPQYLLANNVNNLGQGGPRGGLGNGVIQPNNSGRPMLSRNGSGGSGTSNNNGNGGKRGVPAPSAARATWSYGSGISMSGISVGNHGSGDSIGPRFNNTNRRNTSSGGNSRSSSTNCDDVSSVASSSTTSSSSRRTFTSTTSSQQQHPLPPRPDWAVGLKAQPTLASRHTDHSLNNSRNMSPISPSRSNGQNSPAHSGQGSNNSPRQPLSSSSLSSSSSHFPVSLQATDFPPLTTGGVTPEKRTPVATGAWAASRPSLSPNLNGSLNTPQSPKGEETGTDYRVSTKAGELYTPKLVRRTAVANVADNNSQGPPRSQQSGKEVKPDLAMLAGQVASMSIREGNVFSAADTHSPSLPAIQDPIGFAPVGT